MMGAVFDFATQAAPDDCNYDRLPQQGALLPRVPIRCAAHSAGREIPDRPWLVRDLIPGRTVTIIGGDGGVGKSTLALQLAVATATGADWIGTLPTPAPVVYISAEDDEDEIDRRLLAMTDDLADLVDLHTISFADSDALIASTGQNAGTVDATPLWHAVKQQLDIIGPGLLVLDNVADVYGGDEIKRGEVRSFVAMLRREAIVRDMAVVMLQHPSLSGLTNGSGSSGSTAWNNSVRSRLYLDRVKAKGGDEPDPDLRVLRTMKANYAPDGGVIKLRWDNGRFRLHRENDNASQVAKATKADRVFIELLERYRSQGRNVGASTGTTYAPSVFASDANSEGLLKGDFRQAMDRHLASARIRIEESGPPSKRRSRLVIASLQ